MREESMEQNKKKWITPQLIILGRGTPEENVLIGCKTSKLASANNTQKGCSKKSIAGQCIKTQCNTISKTS
jgi:hypothetical protein